MNFIAETSEAWGPCERAVLLGFKTACLMGTLSGGEEWDQVNYSKAVLWFAPVGLTLSSHGFQVCRVHDGDSLFERLRARDTVKVNKDGNHHSWPRCFQLLWVVLWFSVAAATGWPAVTWLWGCISSRPPCSLTLSRNQVVLWRCCLFPQSTCKGYYTHSMLGLWEEMLVTEHCGLVLNSDLCELLFPSGRCEVCI